MHAIGKTRKETQMPLQIRASPLFAYTNDIQCFSIRSTQSWTDESIRSIISAATVSGPMNLVIRPTRPVAPISIVMQDEANRVPWSWKLDGHFKEGLIPKKKYTNAILFSYSSGGTTSWIVALHRNSGSCINARTDGM